MQRQEFIDYLSGKPSKRIPGSFWLHNSEDKWEGEAAKLAHLTLLEQTGIDFLKIMDEIRFAFPTIRSASDWDHYLAPRRKSPQYQKQFDVIGRISDALGGSVFLYTTIFSPLRCVGMPCGYNMIESHMRENPNGVSRAFAAMAQSLAQYAMDCMESGADSIYFSAKGAEHGRFPGDLFETVVLRHDRELFDSICSSTPYAMLHICGLDMELSHYYDWPGAAVNWDVHNNVPTLHQGASLFRHPVVCGGMDDRSGELVNGTESEIKEKVRSVVEPFLAEHRQKRMILGADCTLPTEVEFHRIRTALDALQSYRL